jgi:hypothetical protein
VIEILVVYQNELAKEGITILYTFVVIEFVEMTGRTGFTIRRATSLFLAKNATSPLIPYELQLNIWNYLGTVRQNVASSKRKEHLTDFLWKIDPDDLCAVSMICKSFNQSSSNDYIWVTISLPLLLDPLNMLSDEICFSTLEKTV